MKGFRATAAWLVLRLHPDLRDSSAAFGSQFILNLSFFAIVFVASFLLEPADFVRLSLASSYIIIIAMVFDFGVNSASLKLSIENNQKLFVEVNLALKAGLFLISLVMLILAAALAGPVREVAIVCAAAAVAFWSATRTIEQYQRRFLRYSALNLVLAASRILFGSLALLTKSWVLIMFALHVLAPLPIHIATLGRLFRRLTVLKGLFKRSEMRILRRMAPPFFLNALFFIALPVIVQTALYLRGDIAGTGAFSLVLLLLGVMGLLNATLRIYLQPQILLTSLNSVDVFGLGRGSLHILVAAYAGLLLLIVIPTSFVFQWVYEARFPQVGSFLLIYAGTMCLINAVGIYNMRAMRRDLIWTSLSVNVLRIALTAPLLILPQISALAIIIWSALVLLGGELLLMWLLTIANRPHQTSWGTYK